MRGTIWKKVPAAFAEVKMIGEEFAPRGKEVIPATWIIPPLDESAPALLLLHGLSSNKERKSSSAGRALARRPASTTRRIGC